MPSITYTVTCLSPVHVGTGTQFGKFDAVYDGGSWYRIDLDRVLTRGADANELALAMGWPGFSWASWMRERHIPPAEVADYGLRCPEAPGEVLVREAQKDPWGQPYLPGSSVKGAMRTAVLWELLRNCPADRNLAEHYLALCLRARELFDEIRNRRAFDNTGVHREVLARLLGVSLDEAGPYQQSLYKVLGIQEGRLGEPREWHAFQDRLARLVRSREWLAQRIERSVFGRDPNHDLLRAVRVCDSETASLDALTVGLVWTYTLRNDRLVEKREDDGDYRTFLELLPEDAALRLEVNTDDFLFGRTADKDLHFSEAQKQAVRQLAHTCNDYARSLIDAETAHFARYGPGPMQDFYADLGRALLALPPGAFLLNVGWGGGWEVKTVGHLLREALGDNWEALRERYSLGRHPKSRQIDWQAPFPKTRRIAYDRGAPRWALGWVRLTPTASG